jgi:hypothetical protein
VIEARRFRGGHILTSDNAGEVVEIGRILVELAATVAGGML